jgi:hypothetical protein
MKNLGSLVVLLLFLLALLSAVADRFAARHYVLEAAPPSAFDMAIESRTTPPAESSGRSGSFVFGAGVLALAVVVFGGAILAMTNGGEFLRQLRLNRKRKHRRQSRPPLTISTPPGEIPQLPAAPQLRRLPVAEDWQE